MVNGDERSESLDPDLVAGEAEPEGSDGKPCS